MTAQNTVLLGMSGGVDSSVSAYVLKQRGYKVIGVTMQIYSGEGTALPPSGKSGCYGPDADDEIEAAKQVADSLGIEHYAIPLMPEYQHEVLDYFRHEYLDGRTPNPCVRCNLKMKFGFMQSKAKELGIDFDYFATGHYCRLIKRGEDLLLTRAKDERKDQTYFLARLKASQLKNVIFPLGELEKGEVKRLAEEIGWHNLAVKKESQDFIAADSYDVLFNPEDSKCGPIIDDQGKVIGEHHGLIHYTIGQRKGLGLGGGKETLFVIALDKKNNALIVGPREKLYSTSFNATDANWFISNPTSELQVLAKIRQTARFVPAKVKLIDNNCVDVSFEQPQLAVTPGQIAAFYQDECLVGSAVIEKAF